MSSRINLPSTLTGSSSCLLLSSQRIHQGNNLYLQHHPQLRALAIKVQLSLVILKLLPLQIFMCSRSAKPLWSNSKWVQSIAGTRHNDILIKRHYRNPLHEKFSVQRSFPCLFLYTQEKIRYLDGHGQAAWQELPSITHQKVFRAALACKAKRPVNNSLLYFPFSVCACTIHLF